MYLKVLNLPVNFENGIKDVVSCEVNIMDDSISKKKNFCALST
jgi:hypothetical protein